MSMLRFGAALGLLFALSLTASAEEGFFSRLNPFGGSEKSAKPAPSKPAPGNWKSTSRKKPEKSMIGKTVDSVSSTTKTAWSKTTSALNPMNLLPSSGKSKKKSTSSWSTSKAQSEPGDIRTVSGWIGQPRPEP